MSYDTLYFALFLAVTWAVFEVLPWRGPVLLVASIVFYAAAGLRDSLVAATVILANFGFQFPIMRDRRWLYPALVFNIGCLAYFKYRVFLATAAGFDVFGRHLIIPLGISFYIFQLTAFQIDLSRGRAKPFIRCRVLRFSSCSSASLWPGRSCVGGSSGRRSIVCSTALCRAAGCSGLRLGFASLD